MEKNEKGCFNVHVYSPGNMFANNITFEAPVYIGGANNLTQQNGFTDDQIAQAIKKINGDGKPLDSKRKWAAVHWFLRWACNYPSTPKEFCERVEGLPLGDLQYECDYNSIRHFSTLTFMNQDARQIDKVKPNKQDEPFFLQCREVVLALAEELGKASFPKPKI